MAWRTHDHTLQLAEGHIEVRCAGPAPQQAPTIILLHEGLGCLSRWRDFPERLAVATGMGVLAFSLDVKGVCVCVCLFVRITDVSLKFLCKNK